MRRLIFLGIAALCIVVQGHAEEVSATQQEIIDLEMAWNKAWQQNDVAFLEKIYADEFLVTDSDGSQYTKSQEIALFASGEYRVEIINTSDMVVRIYGDTAVVTGRNAIKATYKGEDASATVLFMDVFVKRNGRWQVVAIQVTDAPKG